MQNEQHKALDFDSIRLKVASPETIKTWSYGEVVKPETINYRTQKPEKDGLFCEKIFGPTKDWECYCGKYKRIRYKGIICEKCGVEVTRSLVRRERMGHIELATPISHIWFLKGIPSKIGLILDLSAQQLEKVIYFANFIITKVDNQLKKDAIEQLNSEFKQKKKQIEGNFENSIKQVKSNAGLSKEDKNKKISELEVDSNNKLKELENLFDLSKKEIKELKTKQIISENTYHELSLKYGHIFEASIGAEAIHQLLKEIDLDGEIKILDEEMKNATTVKKRKLIKRYKLLANFRDRGVKPEAMILTVVPVIPPDLRPMVALDGGRFAASDLNDLYRRVINRNNRLKKLLDLNAPEVIVRNEKRMLQEAVDALIDNTARHGKTVTASTGQKRMLKSLADSLKGKQGRFRQNLLGKRVDYSGRSVIVVGPHLKLYQCGLPKKMALELFRPFVISKLIGKELAHNVRSANKYIEAGHTEVYDILEKITDAAHVLLNRAPTLHRLGIQAFQPVLIEGKAIQLHPLVCSAFNADFDGDQMAVHVPLTDQAKKEAAEIMLSANNLLRPGDGSPITTPSQDIVLGAYYMTTCDEEDKDEKEIKYFSSPQEAILAYELRNISLQNLIRVKLSNDYLKSCENKPNNPIKTTVGRLIFNEILPEKIRFINEPLGKTALKKIISSNLEHYGIRPTADLLDSIKSLSLKYVTISGISWSMSDLPDLPEKDDVISESKQKVDEIQSQYEMGLLTDDERKTKIIKLWFETTDKVTGLCKKELLKVNNNPVHAMMDSGARGSWVQTSQMMGMRGLQNNPSGETIELPVISSFKQGFNVLEYFISTHGARKGLSDTALRTASAGYLTRKLVDVSQGVIINEDDCGDTEGVIITHQESEEMGEDISKRILGRTALKNINHPETKKTIVKKGEIIGYQDARDIEAVGIEEVPVRSVLSCKSNSGLCAKCYGWDLGYNSPVKLGTAVGVVAAQSIGEPGTQLTMRTFHTGGVAQESGDVTQGLPRVEEIFEARSIKKSALMSPINGVISIIEDQEKKQKIIKISGEEEKQQEFSISDSDISGLQIKNKDKVKKGDVLFENKSQKIEAELSGKILVENKDGQTFVSLSSKKKVEKELPPVRNTVLWIKDGEEVERGQQLSEGALDLHELYRLRGRLATQRYVVKEIQYIYSSQGQKLNDKHVEIIARQMFSRVFILDSGDSEFAPGETVELAEFNLANEKLIADGKKVAKGENLLLGITKASLSTSSFLSSASFQETARILIDAAVSGRVDTLQGLKENVIIGRLIPAGTGFQAETTSTKETETE